MSFADSRRSSAGWSWCTWEPDDWTGEPALRPPPLARRARPPPLARRCNAGSQPALLPRVGARPRRPAPAPPPATLRAALGTDTTGTNPRFHVQIPRAEASGARKCHVVVSVTQLGTPAARRLHAVGFAVYRLPAAAARRAPAPARPGTPPAPSPAAASSAPH
ncbi:myb-related transcription factor, partner of profilin-like [Achroia grisella]|uniref:myb-related transcription factor, partner of profilin-like n=1 Tax=Achroia grisella TaxID=688607 RepID=UPI0027D203E7|nr:myb-related transcription factor, partner of profilin-like [Achroia grisella]